MKFEKNALLARSVNDVKRLNDVCQTLTELNEGDFIARIFYNSVERDKWCDFEFRGGFLYNCQVEINGLGDIEILGIAYIVGRWHVIVVDFYCKADDFSNGTFNIKEVI